MNEAGRDRERLYALLPAIFRSRDALQGAPLRALLGVMGEELLAIEEDIARLYDGWFIETCPEWLIPYIGDLAGARALLPVDPQIASQRAYVANSLAYRRRKGSAAMVEQLARDVTGWPARAVELFQGLSTTQFFNHLRPGNVRTPDLRQADALERLNGPFETTARAADVRHADSGRGRHGLSSLGIFLWRLEALPVVKAPAAPAGEGEPGAEPGCFRFSVLGNDAPLFNSPRSEEDMAHLAEELHVPGRLRRRPLHEELEARRAAMVRGATPEEAWFASPAVIEVYADGRLLPPEQLLVCDLSTWAHPPTSKRYPDGRGGEVEMAIAVGVDPVLGRLAFPRERERPLPRTVHVSWYQGFSSGVGGGFYERQATFGPGTVYGVAVAPGPGQHPSLVAAMEQWALDGWPEAAIEILDSERHDAPPLIVPPGKRLEIRGANVQRPTLRAPADGWAVTLGERAALTFNGLLVAGGRVDVAPGDGAAMRLVHATLVPGHSLDPAGAPEADGPSLVASGGKIGFSLTVTSSITGPLWLQPASDLRLEHSVVDGLGGEGIRGDARGTAIGSLAVESCTVLGGAQAEVLELASDSVFTGAVQVVQQQRGCARFCALPPGSRTPKRFRCQPDLARDATAQEQAELGRRVRPFFTSERYGHPGYCQLRADTAEALRRNASDGGEPGVFHHLQQPQRETNLRTTLGDYLRFGLEAGIFYVS
ncbi:MAG TPA: hypothetical protein VIG99_16990 [Myxococcaceae bacterium]|jgi:hypothetical protein